MIIVDIKKGYDDAIPYISLTTRAALQVETAIQPVGRS